MKLLKTLGFAIIASLVAGGHSAALAGSKKPKRFQSALSVLDTRAASQYSNSVRLQPPRVVTPSKWDHEYSGTYNGPYLQMAKDAARRHGVPEGLFLKLVQQESGWNAKAVSHKGAMGLAQLMPGTAKQLGVNAEDPAQNLDGGARYLAEQYRSFGSWRLALAAYNAGPHAVRKYGGVPPYKETRNYVRIIYGS